MRCIASLDKDIISRKIENSEIIIPRKLGRYEVDEKIASGGFGIVVRAHSISSGKNVAIKIEMKNLKYPQLKVESQFQAYLSEELGDRIPYIYGLYETKRFKYNVMELFDITVLKYLEMNSIPLYTTLYVGIQILETLRLMHNLFVVHRDIKPANFMLSFDRRRLVLIDFGFCKKYYDVDEGHIENVTRLMMYTKRYVSVWVEAGQQSSRRDDLISLGYSLISMHSRSLPWDSGISKTKYITRVSFPDCPSCLNQWIEYLYTLDFESTPDYEYLSALLSRRMNTCQKKEIIWEK